MRLAACVCVARSTTLVIAQLAVHCACLCLCGRLVLQGRMHAFRKLRAVDDITTSLSRQPGMLRWLELQGLDADLTRCGDRLRTPMSSGDLCVSIAWDWQYAGSDAKAVVAEATVRGLHGSTP